MTSLAIIGSTGSIGRNAIDVIENHIREIEIAALSAGGNIELLAEQIRRHRPGVVSVSDDAGAKELKNLLGSACPDVMIGEEALRTIASTSDADIVLVCVAGSLGVWPAWDAVRAGKRLALATKEALVLLGDLLSAEAEKSEAEIVPVDSEHSALFQLLRGVAPEEIHTLWLSASGGPFRKKTAAELQAVTPEEALDHPVWSMGQKVTIDSATLMNKGLEIIEARWLFDVPPDKVNVVIHPQGLVHAMVELVDGTILMHAGMPDMRSPIAFAISHPGRVPGVLPRLDLAEVGKLRFDGPDPERFPCLKLARRALEMGGAAPAALNAADEIAVNAFLEKRIKFTDIPKIIGEVLDRHDAGAVTCPEDALESDASARKMASEIVKSKQP